MTERSLLLTLPVLLLFAIDPASADNSTSGICERDAVCRKHSAAGHKLYQDRKYTEALTEFQAAYDLKPEPRLLINIGRTLFHLGRPRAALHAYEQYQHETPPGDESQHKVEQYIAEAKIAIEAEIASTPPEEKKAAAPPPPPVVVVAPVEKTPIYKKWWFWTSIGAGAVAIGLGVGLGVGFGRQQPTPYFDVVWR